MSQLWNANMYQSDHNVATDMQNIENNLLSLHSLFSGTTQPSGAEAGMPWFDTTNKILKIRNQANSAWLGVMYGNSSNKVWMYSNSATDGWAIDAAVTDAVIALKGGSQAYNTSGGTTAGTWTQPDATLTIANLPVHDHGAWSGYYDVTHAHGFSPIIPKYGSGGSKGLLGNILGGGTKSTSANITIANSASLNHRHSISAQGSGTSHQHGTTYRPTAAMGTLQYPNV